MKMIIISLCTGFIIGGILIISVRNLRRIEWYKPMKLVGIFFCIILLGAILNGVAVVINDWQMPVKEGIEFREDKWHKQADSNTRLRPLIDRFEFAVFSDGVYSVGDIIMSIGNVLFISMSMVTGKLNMKKLLYSK